MEQLPLGESISRRQKSPNARRNVPLPVLILGGFALVLALFSTVILIKMGSPAPTQDVEAEIAL